MVATTVRSEDAACWGPACWGDEAAGKGRHRNRSFRPERVRLLQSLYPRPQKRLWPVTYSRSQTSESRHGKKFVQDDHIETDPLANMPRGLVHVTGSERHIISHKSSHPPLEIRIQRTLQASSNSPPLEETAVGVGVIPARVMGPACVADERKPFDLTERVLNTMAEARATSTRCLYALKLSIFSG